MNTSHKGFFLATLERLMKYWPGGSYLVMKSTPRVPGDIPIMAIGYKCNSRKVLGFITSERSGSTEPGDPYLSCFLEKNYNVSIRSVVRPHLIGRSFNACNTIDNHNRTGQSEIDLEKCWVTHSGYFRLATIVALGMEITNGKILFCHGIKEGSVDKKNQ